MAQTVDIAILGGGLAGNLLARQLIRRDPSLKIGVYERDESRSYKVGESTVEIATNYLIRRVNLSTYIYKSHLPKNGLRFFFDDESKNTSVEDMSEIGTDALPPYPSFQLDRARLEEDLLEMNRAEGVSVRTGVLVKNLELSKTDAPHRFHAVRGDETETVEATWVVDATGRAGLIANQLKLRLPVKEHRVAASWARFRGVRDIDDTGNHAWRERCRFTSRALSTNHFCYRGYWIWFIPLRDGLTSVGVVREASKWDTSLHREEGLRAFLSEHRAPNDLLGDGEMVDIGAFTQLAFRTKNFFGENRWAVIGDAAAFTDPFYSPGSDFIAIENDLVTDLVMRHRAGEDISRRRKAYDDFMHFRFEATLLLYKDLYPMLGSYELFRQKCFFDTGGYYNQWFDSYARGEHLDLKTVKRMVRRKGLVMDVMRNFSALFSRSAETLASRGQYYRQNVSHFEHERHKAFGLLDDVGQERSSTEVDRYTQYLFNTTFNNVAKSLGKEPLNTEKGPEWFLSEAMLKHLDLGDTPDEQGK